MVSVATGIALGTLVGAGLSGQDGHVFETIGDPVRSMALNMWLATEGPDGHAIGWATYEAPDGLLLLGVGLDDGRVTKVDLAGYGRSHTRMTKGPGGNIYLYSGNPGHFLRYDVTTRALEDLGVPATPANYWLGQAVGPDGRFWVGTYPEATLVSCDMQTGEIQNHGQMRDDDKQAYIIRTAVSDAGIVYNAVGLHHRELWAYDPATGARTQILPEEMTTQQGAPDLWIATDGHVYGKSGAATFRCKPDGIEIDESGNRYSDPEQKRAGGVEIGHIDANGELAITDLDTGETRMLATEYGGQANPIYCVSCERDGKIYGGSGSGSRTFSYDPATGELTDLGRLTSGSIQVYDIVNMPRGLFQSSYMGASMDVYDPDQPREAGKNPVRIASAPGQERPVQWTEGPDGKLYLGTVPVKGHLGGALTQVDPETLESRHWSQIIHNQSIYYVAPVPQTNQLVYATSVGGGSSAIPTEKEACIFIW
ncbi:MAG TPA: hypothetical protein QGH10_05705, partial [Armatimonadota bacterium]|nr:hypothetical protein [Armatimonadota bacterium]